MCYSLEFRELTLYGLTRAQYIRKPKQIFGQTILSSPQAADFNPNFAKNCDILVVKNSVTRPVTPAVLTTDSLSTFYSTLITCQIPAYNLYTCLIQKSLFVWIQYITQNCPKVAFLERRRQDVDDRAQRKQTLTSTVVCFINLTIRPKA